MGKGHLKSKTVWFSILLGVLGIVETNAHLLQGLLGDYYGVVFIGISVTTYILRAVTTEPLK